MERMTWCLSFPSWQSVSSWFSI